MDCRKGQTTGNFGQATLRLHKWHSNVKELELDGSTESEDELTYAKQQLGVKSSECGLLGLKWNKLTDQMCLNFLAEVAQPTKRERS